MYGVATGGAKLMSSNVKVNATSREIPSVSTKRSEIGMALKIVSTALLKCTIAGRNGMGKALNKCRLSTIRAENVRHLLYCSDFVGLNPGQCVLMRS